MARSIKSPLSKKLNTRACIELAPLLPRRVQMFPALAKNLSDSRKRVRRLRRALTAFEDSLKDLESNDSLTNFEIQRLMSQFNQAEQLASSVQKKKDDTANAIISKVG